jgi:hypothetical protein
MISPTWIKKRRKLREDLAEEHQVLVYVSCVVHAYVPGVDESVELEGVPDGLLRLTPEPPRVEQLDDVDELAGVVQVPDDLDPVLLGAVVHVGSGNVQRGADHVYLGDLQRLPESLGAVSG